MKRSSLVATLLGILPLVIHPPTIQAQGWPGYSNPSGAVNPYTSGYNRYPSTSPVVPYAGGLNGNYPSASPYPGNYGGSIAQPSNPYAQPYPGNYGGYGAQPSNPPVQTYQRGYGGYTPQLSIPSGVGYPANASAPYPGTLNGPYPPAVSQPGAFGSGPVQPYVGYSAPNPGVSSVVALADQLTGQADAFLQGFVPTARIVPEGQQFIAEASAVRDGAARLRQLAASGVPLAALGNEYSQIAGTWQQMQARMYRISHGRVGPNIATALQMGPIIEQIGSLLR